jgi:nitrite reductase/ring-hydroxylating ferredoxin subunit
VATDLTACPAWVNQAPASGKAIGATRAGGLMSGENWVAVGNRGELDEGAMKGIELGDLQIAIYNVEGEIYATDNICTHAFAMLTDGFLDGDVIECPLHGGCFKVKTGEGMGAPISEDIKTYPVRLNGDTIEINIG